MIKEKTMKKLFGIVALTLILASCDDPYASGPIRIGAILPISGRIAEYGIQTRDAAILAVEEINAAGGVLGRQVNLIVEDDEADPTKTANAFTKLVERDKISALIGALTSNCSLAITNLAMSEKIPMVSPTSTNDKVTLAGDYVFRACYIDSFQGQVVANYAIDTLKATRAAILYDVANDYSKGLFENFKKVFEGRGGTVVSESYNTGDKDFNAQITKIRSANPNVIFLPDYYSAVALIAEQIRNQGIKVPLLGADGWDEVAGKADTWMVPAFYSNHYSPESQDPDVVKFIAAYKARFGVEPNALAALGYDTAKIILQAISAAGSARPQDIQKALMNVSGKFVTGNISFDANRNPVKSAVMVEIVAGADGKLTTGYAGTVNP
jgi:branched-chain amino acid transport system substrate-binding protein